MIVLAIFATIAALVRSWIVIMANGMSDAPQQGFQGGWMIAAAWITVAVLWLSWWFKVIRGELV